MKKIEKIKNIAVCPKCKNSFRYEEGRAMCANCKAEFICTDERIELYAYDTYEADEKDSLVFSVKSMLKKFPRLYKFLLYAVGPPQVSMSAKQFLRGYSNETIILNIGSGSKSIRPDVIDVDMYPYSNVNFLSDALAIPIRDNSVDAIVCESLIEHLKEPRRLVGEMHRILKPGGKIYIIAPFMLGFHSSPNDFYRWTDQGLMQLFGVFKDKRVSSFYGPTSALTFLLGEWLAILFSFNIRPLYNFWILVSMVMQFFLTPIQWLDYAIARYPYAKNISYGFSLVAKKE